MPDNINDQIRARIEDFTDELSELIREAAMEAVREALGADAAAPTRGTEWRSTKRRSTKKRVSKRRSTKGRASKKKAGRRRGQSDAQVTKLSAEVVRALQAEPEQSISDLAAGIGTTSAQLKRPIAELLTTKQIKKKGQRRGTRYSAA